VIRDSTSTRRAGGLDFRLCAGKTKTRECCTVAVAIPPQAGHPSMIEQGGIVAAKDITTPMRLCTTQLIQNGFLPTQLRLSSGATILTSLDYAQVLEMIFSTTDKAKGRLRRKPDGGIEVIDSLWVEYGDTHTDLHHINDQVRIKDRMISLLKNHGAGGRPIVIVDWGCGAGHTLAQLDHWLRKMKITNSKLFGFANEFHVDWLDAPSNLTFILDVADNLHRYFNARTVDFIYSIAGLYYLFLPEIDRCDDDMLEFFRKHRFDGRLFQTYEHTERYLEALSFIMKTSGELLMDLPSHIIDIDFDLLKSFSRNYRTLRNPEKYGEQAYVLVPNRPVSQANEYGARAYI
jgi:hypothetical protein